MFVVYGCLCVNLYELPVLGAQRVVLWQRRNNTVEPFNETVQQVSSLMPARVMCWTFGTPLYVLVQAHLWA